MKCTYRFQVVGILRLKKSHPIPMNGRLYTFVPDEKTHQANALVVEVPADNRNDWPTFSMLVPPPTDPRAPKYSMVFKSPNYSEVMDDVRAIEAILSLQGVDKIEMDEVTVEFLPETPEERNSLDVSSFQMTFGDHDVTNFPPKSFDVLARSVLAAAELKHLRTAMSFFGKGNLDMKSRRYIDAFYDFFFVIETLFADGKSRTLAMKESFAKSPVLLASTKAVIKDEASYFSQQRSTMENRRFCDLYARSDPIETLASLIEMRGHLHHHASKRPGIWDPSQESTFKVDSIVLQMIAFKVLWSLAEDSIFSERAIRRYQNLFTFQAR
jgi:hypothetical protein